MAKTTFDIKPLFESLGVEIQPKPGIVELFDRMEIPETNSDDEWIKLGLVVLNELKKSGFKPKTVADIGTGNGIIAIGFGQIFQPKTIYLTDIIKEVLQPAKKNLQNNLKAIPKYKPKIIVKQGRDAGPFKNNSLDLVLFSPPPLMVEDENLLNNGLTRTTLIERKHYSKFANNSDDLLLKWSLLPWYSFLLNIKKKMKKGGIIIGLYSGRIPFNAIKEAHKRAGVSLSVPKSIVKKQQDPVYLAEYAKYEKRFLNGESFDFYDYEKAKQLMKSEGLKMPGVIDLSPEKIKEILKPAKISAIEAYQTSLKGLSVAHVGYALVVTIPKK
ncbi:MAG: methyltransferase [archaeon]|nr:methyltransferase [archaeon]